MRLSREHAELRAAALRVKELWADDKTYEPWVYDEAINKLTELV